MKISVYQNKIKTKVKKEALTLYKKGLSLRKVAIAVGKSHTWVAKVVRNSGDN